MKSVEQICQQLAVGEFEFSRHAFRRAVERNISDVEIREAGAHAKLLEDYPDDKYAPSALLLGFTHAKRPLHIQVARHDAALLKIITLYEPDPADWVEYRKRR